MMIESFRYVGEAATLAAKGRDREAVTEAIRAAAVILLATKTLEGQEGPSLPG